MPYKKKTLRRMQHITRRYARILNDLDSVTRRLHNLTQEIGRLELDSTALLTATRQDTKHANLDEFLQDELQHDNGAELEKRIDAAEIFYDPALKDVDPQTGEDELTDAVDKILPGRIHWEKAGEVHATLDPQTGQTEILSGKEDACPPTE
jgi:hypothetical protein